MILVTETIPLKTKLEEGEKLEEKSKKSKKKNKKVKKILQESTADIDYDLRDSYHKDTLRALIIMYFRILKSNNDSLIPLTLRVYILLLILVLIKIHSINEYKYSFRFIKIFS